MIDLANYIAATAGLGTASFALVDATKALGGGISNRGFGFIERAVKRFVWDSEARVLGVLHANWINGVALPDQKAIAKSLVKLHFRPGPSLERFAQATNRPQ